MPSEKVESEELHDYRCRRCRQGFDREDQWFNHSWDEHAAAEKVEVALDEGRSVEDFFADGAMLCPSCHADFLVFIGVADDTPEVRVRA